MGLKYVIYDVGSTQARRHGGAFRGRVPQITACSPPKQELCRPKSGLCAKKVTDSVPLECILTPVTPKILVITSDFVKTHAYFEMNIFVFWASLSNSKEKSFCVLQKLFMPLQPLYAGAGLGSSPLGLPMQRRHQAETNREEKKN